MPKVATLLFTPSSGDSNGTTYDATVSGLGDVTGFYYSFAAQDIDSSEDIDRFEYAGCGGIDSGGNFDCYSISNQDIDGVGTSNSFRYHRFAGDDKIQLFGTIVLSVARITDGLRLTKIDGVTGTRQVQICIHAVSGCKVSVGTFTVGNNTNIDLTTNASDGTGNIDCNTAFFISVCNNPSSNNTYGDIALQSTGFAQRVSDTSFRQWSQNWHSRDGQSTMQITSRFSTTAVLNQVAQGSLHWTAPVTDWTANGSTSRIRLTATNSGGQANGDHAAYIAFDDTLKAYVDTKLIAPFSSGSETLTGNSATGVNAKHLFIGAMSVSDDDTNDAGQTSSTNVHYWRSEKSSSATISQVNTYGYSADNVGTSETASKNENSSGVKVTYYAGYEQTLLTGTTSFSNQDASFSRGQVPMSTNVPFGYFLVSDDWTDDVTMDADAATFTLTGQSADLRVVTRMSAAAGSFSLTGQAAAYGFGTVASTGSFALTGVAADFSQNTAIDAAAGSFSLTLQMPSISLTVDATTQNYVVTGIDATLDDGDDSLSAETGSFSVTGKQAFYGVTLGTAAGSFQLSGSFTTLIDSGSIVATPIYYRFLMQEE